MRAIRLWYGAEFAVRKAFEVGNDVIVFRFHQEEERKAIETVMKQVRTGKLKEGRINRSVRRIVKIKEKYGLFEETETEGINIDEINEEIKKIRTLCGLE